MHVINCMLSCKDLARKEKIMYIIQAKRFKLLTLTTCTTKRAWPMNKASKLVGLCRTKDSKNSLKRKVCIWSKLRGILKIHL